MNGQQLDRQQLESYLSEFIGQAVQIEELGELGSGTKGAAALKAFGYGRPIRIIYRTNGEKQQLVLRRVNRNGFGRERDSDRVAEVWRDYHTFNKLPQHIKARDMVALAHDGRLASLAHVGELLLLTDYAPGQPYADNLLRIANEGKCTYLDVARAESLASYLATIHSVKHDDPLLWRRRLRDLVGHGEGIMGLADSYPQDEEPALFAQRAVFGRLPKGRTGEGYANSKSTSTALSTSLQAIETEANRWRWWLKPLVHRLSQVHGDFHPFNVLFTESNQFTLLDRSRGEWGEPADDVSCMTINYLFFSLQRADNLTGPFEKLYLRFWETYLARSGDDELLSVIAPWFAWRTLVLASPQWYPTLTPTTRRQLLNFGRNVMAEPQFNWREANRYLED